MIIFKIISEDLKKKSRLKVLKILFKEVKTIFFKKNLYTIFSSFLGLVQVVHLNPLGSRWSNPCFSKVISFALIHEKCYAYKQFHNNSTTIFMREGEGNSTRTITDLNQWMITFYLLLLLLLLLLLFLIIIIILWKWKYLDWVGFLLIYIYI